MTNPKELPNAGYNLGKIYFPELSLQVVELPDDAPEQPRFQFGWDWKKADQEHFEVSLVFDIGASKPRPEKIRVIVCGIFKPVGTKTNVALEEFVRLQGPAILFPYAREAISSLTSRSFFNVMHLPPLNIFKMMEDLDPSITTGARQLREEVNAMSPSGHYSQSGRAGARSTRSGRRVKPQAGRLSRHARK